MNHPTLIYEDAEMVNALKEFFITNGLRPEWVDKLCEYTLSRVIEEVFLVRTVPVHDPRIDFIAAGAINKHRRHCADGEQITLSQDVGKLLYKVSSTDLPFDCSVHLQGTVIVLRPA